MKRKFILVLGLLLLISFAFSAELTPTDLTWNGAVSIKLDKDTFSDGENVTGQITIANKEDYPIIGGVLVLQIAQGTYDYPSQFSQNDNVILEETISDIWVIQNTLKEIPFDLGPISGGDFRMDTYFSVLRSKHTGASWILMAPMSKNFSVEGDEYERMQIFRALTNFNNVIGPVGFPVSPEEELTGNIFIINETGQTKNNVKIGIQICDWSTGFCDTPEEIFDVGTISPNNNQPVSVKVSAPKIPSAYAININLYSNDVLESVYKNRVIVSGGTAKLRKILIDGFDKKNYSLTTIFSGSPDHFNFPSFSNFSLDMKVFLEDKTIQEESVDFDNIETSEIFEQEFDIKSNNFDRVCLEINKKNTKYDEFCFDVPLADVQEAYDLEYPEIVKVNWTYNEEAEELALNLTKSIPINSRVRIVHNQNFIFEELIEDEDSYNTTIFVPKDNVVMIVDDFDAKNQQTISLNFGLSTEEEEVVENGEIATNGELTAQCDYKICENGLVCSGSAYASAQGVCCMSECIPAVESEGFLLFGIPIVFWIAIILLIAAIAVAGTTIQKVRTK